MPGTLVRGTDTGSPVVRRRRIRVRPVVPVGHHGHLPRRTLMTSLPRALSPLRLHHYRLLAASMTFSLLAAGLWAIALVWQVVALHGGPAALSLVTALGAGGMLASTLLGGALADRIPQRRILLTTESVQGATMAVVAALSLTGSVQLWHLAAVSLVGRASSTWCGRRGC